MNTDHRFRNRHLLSAFVGIVLILSILGIPSAALAAGWSTEVVISPSLPTSTPNAFAINPSGNEVWVTAPLGSSFNVTVQAAQRTFPGGWSSLVTIASVRGTSVQSLSVSLSANDYAAAAWLVGGGVQIALRSPTGAWQAPVSFASTGNVLNVRAKLDALGNGTAVWYRLTATVAVVEAVTWTTPGTFGNVVQLSPSSQGAFLPDLAVNEAGTAVVVWQAAALLDNSNPYQVESATRLAGGSWSAVSAVSLVVPQTWTPRVTLDGSGNATVVWEQGATVNNYRIYAATRPAGGAWSSQTRIEPADWYFAGQNSVDSDATGNVTATWVVEDTSGVMSIHTATRSASGGAWGAVTNLGQCRTTSSLCLFPQVSAARDGSITVVGWGAYGGTSNNVAVRLGLGAWTPMVVGSSNPQLTYVLATNNARASAVWPAPNGVKYHHALTQSDYR
jgi:hypothetical protein